MSNYSQFKVSTSETSPSLSTIPLEDLRQAAVKLTTQEGARRLRIPPIPKRVVGTLIEEAFPAQPRGLAYEEELDELHRYLARCSPPDSETEEVANAAVALLDSYAAPFDAADPDDSALLDLLRATATYVLRRNAVRLAENERDDRGRAQ